MLAVEPVLQTSQTQGQRFMTVNFKAVIHTCNQQVFPSSARSCLYHANDHIPMIL